MKTILSALTLAVLFGSSATAANLCNCCGSGTVASCTKVCETVKPAEGLCLPAVDFESDATIAPGRNPLYEVPLKELDLAGAKREGLEAFRSLLEASRRGVETDRKGALRDARDGKLDVAGAEQAAHRYDNAIVNYYLGMKAYRRAFKP